MSLTKKEFEARKQEILNCAKCWHYEDTIQSLYDSVTELLGLIEDLYFTKDTKDKEDSK
jgi:hypothetical protein